MVMWERPAGPAGGKGGGDARVMYDGRHEPTCYVRLYGDPRRMT